MLRSRRTLLLLILAGMLGVYLWSRVAGVPEEERVRAAIEQVAQGAEDADLEATMEPFSEDYIDTDGVDRTGIYAFLWQQYQKRGPISVWLGPIEVQVQDQQAWASFEVGLVEGAQNAALPWPVGVDALYFEVELALEDGEWRILSHSRSSVVY